MKKKNKKTTKKKAVKKRVLKTITIGLEDRPTHSFCRGHITEKQFAKAHAAEGWRGGDLPSLDKDDPKALLFHGYYRKDKNRNYYRLSRTPKRDYKPATIMEW